MRISLESWTDSISTNWCSTKATAVTVAAKRRPHISKVWKFNNSIMKTCFGTGCCMTNLVFQSASNFTRKCIWVFKSKQKFGDILSAVCLQFFNKPPCIWQSVHLSSQGRIKGNYVLIIKLSECAFNNVKINKISSFVGACSWWQMFKILAGRKERLRRRMHPKLSS